MSGLGSLTEGMTRVESYEDADMILKASTTRSGRAESRQFMGPVLPQLDGPDHLKRRQMEARCFSAAALAEWEREGLRASIDSFFDELFDGKDDSEPIRADLPSSTLRLLTRVGARIAGIDDVDTEQRCEELLRIVSQHINGATVEWRMVSEAERNQIRDDAKSLRVSFGTHFLEPSEFRRQQIVNKLQLEPTDSTDLPLDILTSLLMHRQPEWDPEFITQEILQYLGASIGTSARATTQVIHELFTWFGGHPEDRVLLADPEFLRGAINESLRLHLVVPALLRTTVAAVSLPSGITLQAGERFVVDISRANRDVTVYGEDADSFDPRRGNRPGIVRAAAFAFAAGPHTCIGKRLAVGGGPSIGGIGPSAGTIVTIVRDFLDVGIAPDPAGSPMRDPLSEYDEFISYPVSFRRPSVQR
jgi:cytochrome P450